MLNLFLENFVLIFVAIDPISLLPIFASFTQGLNKKDLINEIISKLNLNISDSDFEEKFSESIFWNNNSEIIEVFKDEPVFDGQFSNACYVDRMQEAFIHFEEWFDNEESKKLRNDILDPNSKTRFKYSSDKSEHE